LRSLLGFAALWKTGAGRESQICNDHASGLHPADRNHYLAESCGADAELRREVESLLEQPVSRPGLLETIARTTSASYDESPVPASIGPTELWA